jgi:hypothetical protein
MKTSFATALCLAVFTMAALVPSADAKLTSIRGNGPFGGAEKERELAKSPKSTKGRELKAPKSTKGPKSTKSPTETPTSTPTKSPTETPTSTPTTSPTRFPRGQSPGGPGGPGANPQPSGSSYANDCPGAGATDLPNVVPLLSNGESCDYSEQCVSCACNTKGNGKDTCAMDQKVRNDCPYADYKQEPVGSKCP